MAKTIERLAQQQSHFNNLDFTNRNGKSTEDQNTSLTLISATPSPFARMNRIALHEKSIPFTLRNEVPWESATQTPLYNPLEKLPVLLFSDGRDPVYDSAHIQEYIVQKYADHPPRLLTGNMDTDLKARQILVLAEGVLDAFVLTFFEKRRGEGKQSADWAARQNRKIDGGIKAFEELVKRMPEDNQFLLGAELTIADIAVGCAMGQIEFTSLRPGWKEQYPELNKYCSRLEERQSFKETWPVKFDLKSSVV